MKQEDAEHKSVKHVSKVEIKTFSDAVAERDNRNVGVTQKYTYTECDRRERRESWAGGNSRESGNGRHEFDRAGRSRTDLRALRQAGLFELHLRLIARPTGGVRRMAGAL